MSSFNGWGADSSGGGGNGAGGALPLVSFANLPAANGNVRMVRLTDSNRGIWVSTGTQWTPISGLLEYRFEDFGGLSGDSSNAVRTANNTAWENIMLAIGALNDTNHPQARVVFSFASKYYFSGPLHFRHPIRLEGPCSSPGLNQNIPGSSGCSLMFPPTGRGVVVDYDPAGITGYSFGSHIEYIQIFHDQTLTQWQANHSYVNGDAVVPIGATVGPLTSSTWTGFVFVNNGSTGTSSGSQPTWTDGLTPTPSLTGGATVSDGTITWTATLCPLLDIRVNFVTVEKVFVGNAYGDGIRLYGNTTDSFADVCRLDHCQSANNRSSGVLISGNDANVNLLTNVSCTGNGTFGLYDTGALASRYINLHLAENGCEPWVANVSPALHTPISPVVANGFEYEVTTQGTFGSSAPVFPTVIGNTVSSGTAVLTCKRKWVGGPYSSSGDVLGLYLEGGQMPAFVGTSGIVIGGSFGSGSSPAFTSDSAGLIIQTQQDISPFISTKISSDPTYDASTVIGDRSAGLVWQQFLLNHKNNVAFDTIAASLSDGYLTFTNGNNVRTLQLPYTIATDSFTGFPIGIRFNNTGASNQVRIKADTAAPVSGAWLKGDITINSAPSELGAGGSKYVLHGWVCTVAGTPGTWLEMRTLTGN